MINTQLEELVAIGLEAFDITFGDECDSSLFELELRRRLMKKYCNVRLQTKTYTSGATTGVTLLNG